LTAEPSESSQDFRVPTATFDAELVCIGAPSLKGKLFVAASAAWHPGPTRPEERMNDENDFFPFLPESGNRPVLINKQSVVAVAVEAAERGPDPRSASDELVQLPDETYLPRRRVRLECTELVLEGYLVMAMPRSRQRLLDYLNQPMRFIALRAGERLYWVNREHIAGATELDAE
jgi:hypothetical protein